MSMKKIIKIFVVSLFITIFVQGQTLLFQVDLTDTSKFVLGGSTADGRRTVYQITGSGDYAPVFRQTDTTKQPIYRFEEGMYFDGNRYMTLYSGQKTLPSTATIFIIARHLGRTPTTFNSYIIGDTSCFVGYDDRTKGLRIFSGNGNYFGRRIDDYGGIKQVLTFRINSNQIYDSLFLNGVLYQAPTPTLTLSNNFKLGILGAYHSGTSFSRQWRGYIYEILVYDGSLTNSQIDSIHTLLSTKHHIPIKKINPVVVPYSNQPMTGNGTQSNPFLIYSVWQLDSLRYVYPKNQKYFIKIMNDIDFSNHQNFFIDSLTLDINGNGKKFKNRYETNANTSEKFCLFTSYTPDTVNVRNLVFENNILMPAAGLYGNSLVSFLYGACNYLSIDSIIIRKCLIRAETRATSSNTVYIKPIGDNLTQVSRLAFEESEIIFSSKSTNSVLLPSVTGTNIKLYSQVSSDKYTTFGKYATDSYTTKSLISFEFEKIENSYFRHKVFYSVYSYDEETNTTATLGSGYSTECCYPIKNNRYIDKTYFSTGVMFTAQSKSYQTISLDSWSNMLDNLDKVIIDTSLNRYFLYYPNTTYSGTLPTPAGKSQMQNISTFSGYDFTNIWAIDPNRNDGYPYLKFNPPPASDIVLNYPNNYILKYGGDTLIVKYNSIYDTTKIFLIVGTDTTLLASTTSPNQHTVTVPYGIKSDSCKIKVSDKTNTSFDISEEYFSIRRDTNIVFISPTNSTTVLTNSNLTVNFLADIDTCKIYFRTNPSSSWQFKGISITVNRSGTLIFPVGSQISFNAQVLITSYDSSITKTSEQFLILSSFFITILSPTTEQQEHNSSGLIIRAMSSGLTSFNFYYKTTGDFVYHSTITVNPGDNQSPDTTTFVFDHKQALGSGQITLLLRSGITEGLIQGSMDTAYFRNTDLQYAGLRSPSVQFQSKQRFSKIFSYNDSLYTISYYAYAYGWYDWHDRVEVFKYNPQTNFFIKILSRGFPNSAPYPSFDFYRTTTWGFALVKPNIYFQTGSVDIAGYSISPLSGVFYKSNTNPIPVNIDKDRTTEVIANFWRYKIEGRKVIAYDLVNQWNKFVLLDFSQRYQNLDQDKFELFTNGTKLFLTNSSYLGELETNWNPSATYTINVFPENIPIAQDDVTIFLSGSQRNNFRGIYPKAIIKVIPRK